MQALPRVLVTRPAREAAQWVQGLSAQGVEAVAIPLIEIAPPKDTAPLQAAKSRITDYAAVMFVSVNAVRAMVGEGGEPRQAMPIDPLGVRPHTRAWAPGPGTERALHAAGWPLEAIDAPAADAAQFDSEALWQQVEPQIQAGQRVLIVRGENEQGQVAGRDWLAAKLRSLGVDVHEVAAYRRAKPTFDTHRRLLAERAAGDGSVWLFSSSEAIQNLQGLLPEQNWALAKAVTTHPRIEMAARRAGFGHVAQARPTLEGVAASIKSLS